MQSQFYEECNFFSYDGRSKMKQLTNMTDQVIEDDYYVTNIIRYDSKTT